MNIDLALYLDEMNGIEKTLAKDETQDIKNNKHKKAKFMDALNNEKVKKTKKWVVHFKSDLEKKRIAKVV